MQFGKIALGEASPVELEDAHVLQVRIHKVEESFPVERLVPLDPELDRSRGPRGDSKRGDGQVDAFRRPVTARRCLPGGAARCRGMGRFSPTRPAT